MSKKLTKEDFINKAKSIHGDKYDYTLVEYVNAQTKVCIICPIHGEFWQTPNNHLRGRGCAKCGTDKVSLKKSSNTFEFISKAKKVHGDKYDYGKTVYVKNNEKVIIICPIHGEFETTPSTHLSGCGCPKCAGKNKTIEDIIKECYKIHHHKYDYSLSTYNGIFSRMDIICPIHGLFTQTVKNHLNGCGCPKCGRLDASEKLMYDDDTFIRKAKSIHQDKYHYDKVNYVNSKEKIVVTCKVHGDFLVAPDKHLQGQGCPKCGHIISKSETEIKEFILKECNLFCIERNREIISPNELDLYIPDKSIAIEYNGLKWHSEEYNKDRNYHLNKTLECEKQGIKLIHIFEDEYHLHKEIILSKLKQLLGYNNDLNKIYARKCTVNVLNKNEAEDFLNKNHIQGFVTSTVYLGCYYNNELVGVMSFKKERKGSDNWELTRFATDISKHCIGVGGKLFSYFTRNYQFNEIKSFADRRWTLDKDDNLYIKLGFKLDKVLKPDYRYVMRNERIHKFNFRKDKLLKRFPDSGLSFDMTEKEMATKLGFYRIWDCGLLKYTFKRKD